MGDPWAIRSDRRDSAAAAAECEAAAAAAAAYATTKEENEISDANDHVRLAVAVRFAALRRPATTMMAAAAAAAAGGAVFRVAAVLRQLNRRDNCFQMKKGVEVLENFPPFGEEEEERVVGERGRGGRVERGRGDPLVLLVVLTSF